MKISKIIVLSFVFSLCAFRSLSQIYSDSTVVVKKYKVTPFTEVSVINKYGNIKVLKSTNDSVLFEIKIKISTNDSLNLERFLENIDFAFTESSQKIEVTTLFKPHKTSFLPNIKDFQKLPVGENKIQVNYTLWLPEYSKLTINNKYGDIQINDTQADLKLNLSNGNLFCNAINDNFFLELQFGSGKIKQMKNGNLHFRYVSAFDIGSFSSIEMDSKSSKISIEKGNSLKIKSKRDNLSIKNIENFYANTFFSNIFIYNLKKNINIESKHSEIKIENINKELESFSINSNFDILELTFKKYTNFDYDISLTNSELEYSNKNFNLSQTKDSTRLETSFYKCSYPKKNTTKVKILLNNSKLSLKKN